MRRAQLLGLGVTGIDSDQDVGLVLGKGSKGRACPKIHPRQFRHTFAHTWLARAGTRATSSG